MRPGDHLSNFVEAALSAGRSRVQITEALREAGWSDREIDGALGAWSDPHHGLPPVPRPRPVVLVRDAVNYGLLFISLVMIVWHVGQLGFGVIDWMISDSGDSRGSIGNMRWAIAALTAFLPVFLVLDRRVSRDSGRDPGRRRSLVRRWFASVALMISALVLLGDLMATIYAALTGDLTLRFAAKAGLVALMGGLVLAYYRGDLDG